MTTNNPPANLNADPVISPTGAYTLHTDFDVTDRGKLGAVAEPVEEDATGAIRATAGDRAGKGFTEAVDSVAEHAYWHGRFDKEPYYEAGRSFEDYLPAYEIGWEGRAALGPDFANVELELTHVWESRRGGSKLDWGQARAAIHAAWKRAGDTYFSNDHDDEPGQSIFNDEVVVVLNALLENCRDGEYGFRACAEEVQSPATRQLFLGRAEQCGQAQSELMALIAAYGGKPAEGGTTSGALQRGWVHVKGALGLDSDASMLESCERGEDTAIASYHQALTQKNLPRKVQSVVQRQAEDAQRNHDQIRDLRNAARARESP